MRAISRRGLFRTSAAALVGTALAGCAANPDGSAAGSTPAAGSTFMRASPSPRPLPPPALVRSNGSIASHTAPRIVWSYDPLDSVTSVWYGQGQVLLTRRESLVSLDAATGQPIWQIPWFGLDAPQSGAVVGRTLYLAGTAGGKGEGLLTIDIVTGHLELAYAMPNGTGMRAVTGPDQGVAYAIVQTGAFDYEIWAIDTSTWKVRWKSPADRFTDMFIHVSANGSHVVYGGVENSLSVYRAADGALAWSTQPTDTCCFNMQGPIGDTIIGYSRTAVFGLDIATGAKVWQAAPPMKPKPPSPSGSLVYASSLPRVYAGGADAYYIWDGTHMTAYRAGDRAEAVWTSALNPDIQFLDELAVSFDGNDSMFIGGHGIFAADTRTGGCRWAFTQKYVDLNQAGAAAGVGTYYIAVPKDGSNLEEKVFALAVD